MPASDGAHKIKRAVSTDESAKSGHARYVSPVGRPPVGFRVAVSEPNATSDRNTISGVGRRTRVPSRVPHAQRTPIEVGKVRCRTPVTTIEIDKPPITSPIDGGVA
jgi:hypothetical protein